jgi:hypothetical protein
VTFSSGYFYLTYLLCASKAERLKGP